MTIGEKIKLARAMRGITQKELGFLVNLPDVRIRQYETDIRTPKASQLQAFSKALGVSIQFFQPHNIDSNLDIMHMLFELDDTRGISISKLSCNENLVTPKYSITFDDSTINSQIGIWYNKKSTTEHNSEEYINWKIAYPEDHLNESAERLRKTRGALLEQENRDSN